MKSCHFANCYLHISVAAFMPYQDIKIKPVSFSVDDECSIGADNLRFCSPYPNKDYFVIQHFVRNIKQKSVLKIVSLNEFLNSDTRKINKTPCVFQCH